jgi:hypothetical protein
MLSDHKRDFLYLIHGKIHQLEDNLRQYSAEELEANPEFSKNINKEIDYYKALFKNIYQGE